MTTHSVSRLTTALNQVVLIIGPFTYNGPSISAVMWSQSGCSAINSIIMLQHPTVPQSLFVSFTAGFRQSVNWEGSYKWQPWEWQHHRIYLTMATKNMETAILSSTFMWHCALWLYCLVTALGISTPNHCRWTRMICSARQSTLTYRT